MKSQDLELFKQYLERQPIWKIRILILFMKTHQIYLRLAKRIGLIKPGENENL